ncbi:MAG: PHP domain-containing protein [Elusimicrobiota bacterium]
MEKIDLHIHSYYSDGLLSPERIVKLAKGKGLSAIALTDHDTIQGIGEILDYAKANKIEIIPGVELSAYDSNDQNEVHILGYFFDLHSIVFRNKLAYFAEERKKRAFEIIKKLNELGVSLKIDELNTKEAESVYGRLHIARSLVKKKIVKTTFDAFNQYLAHGKPAYVPKVSITPEESIRIILEAGGVPVLAHPKFNIKDEKIIKRYIKSGLMGIESYYPKYSKEDTEYYLDFAKKNGLCVSGGSDFHGEIKNGKMVLGAVDVPYTALESIKNKLKP